MTSYDLAHRFFHEPTARGEYARVNTSFYYHEFSDGSISQRYYSYSTCIGEVKKDRKGNNVLILSACRYSKCTSKHIAELWRACPFEVIRVPRVSDGYYWQGMIGKYDFGFVLDHILEYTESELKHANSREYLHKNLAMFDNYVEKMSDMSKDLIKKRNSAKMRKVEQLCAASEQVRAAQKAHAASLTDEQRATNKAKREAAEQRRFDKFMAEGTTLEKIRDAYNVSYYSRSRYWGNKSASEQMKEVLRQLRKQLQDARDEQGRYLSYAWVENNEVRTSQHCHAPIADVKRLLQLWKERKDMLGQRAGAYTVVENDAQHVKIGCHVIPAWNIELLYNRLIAA